MIKIIKYIRLNISFGVLLVFILSLIIAQIGSIPRAKAAYDGGRIIDDAVFLDARSMSRDQVQNFLVSKGSGLANMSFVLNCYAQDSKERQWYTSVGAPCDQSIPASHIIYYASQIYGVNPQVILATMQKEQSLTTAPNPTAWQINQAMGYACPTSGQCGGNSTFPYQIDSGTWALRYHYERARGNNTWWYTSSSWTCGTQKSYYSPNLYPNQNVNFYDQNGTYYRTHYIANAATSAFYCYTPHAYNNPQGLYGREPYGTVGLYYSGSYNFVYFFELWFGRTTLECTNEESPSSEVMRLYNRSLEKHFYTGYSCEASSLVRNNGYTNEGRLFYQTSASSPYAVVVHRLYNPKTYQHLWATTQEDINNATQNAGFRYEGVAFYAVKPTVPGHTVVHRLYNPKTYQHLWATTQEDINNATQNAGFRYEGVAFYGAPAP